MILAWVWLSWHWNGLGLMTSALKLGFVDLGTKGLLIWVVFSSSFSWLCFSICFLCCVLWVGMQWEMGLKKLESSRLNFYIEFDCKRLDLLQWSRALKTWDTSFLNSLETLLTNEIVWGIVLVCNFHTILLVSTFSKLFRKLISWVQQTWFWSAKI